MPKTLSPGWCLAGLQLMCLIWLVMLMIYGLMIKPYQLETQMSRQSAENTSLSQRNAHISAQVDALKDEKNLSVIEERARKDLGMIKDDETFFIFVDRSI